MTALGEHYNESSKSKIAELCQRENSVSSFYAQDSLRSPGETAGQLFGTNHLEIFPTQPPKHRKQLGADDLRWARQCGKFGEAKPSDLFLHAFHDLLQCLEHDPLANCVSPSLCGGIGNVPLTIIAPLNDQMRHMSNLIVRAKKEVLLATNFWKASGASTFVNDALKELSQRAGNRGERVVVKLMYDRGAAQQFWDNHQVVTSSGWQAPGVNLPSLEEMPNVDLEVVNFHRPPLGTFHCKFMVVDREIATISSNNIQDNDNLEMMAHLEGPIVDSLWETFLLSWHKPLDPPAPCRHEPAAGKLAPTYGLDSWKSLFGERVDFDETRLPEPGLLPEHTPGQPHYDSNIYEEIQRMRSVLMPQTSETYSDSVARHLNKPTGLSVQATASPPGTDHQFFPFIPIASNEAVPMAMCSRKPFAALNNESAFVPQNEAWLSLIRNAKQDIFIQTPDLNAKPLQPALVDAVKRGVEVTYYVCLGYNDTGELLPGQGGTNEMTAHKLYSELSEDERSRLKVFFYVAADQNMPIHNSYKQRSCHIKLLIADESVGIQGSGNQDTQSWFHSQEVNFMVDSSLICKAWRAGIERNQNTAIYGRAREDGCWYDQTGKLANGSLGTKPGILSWAKGFVGAINKARGI
ncbi:hypothetical protein K431DRAFT_220806 [Polychaeton citri CBS 116435]|uniref:PLD phosphodiesterase domain-containing protein n=1 Tax=Polychaeton citri CBS 116435 TaxID=1314669 RepID=A0A9P4Q9E9_9PEZI|nr:hypothetical protein K431DRAFT_220806 [Polychaeton citri CBS 116435]